MQTETTFDKVYLYSCLSCPDGYFDILSGCTELDNKNTIILLTSSDFLTWPLLTIIGYPEQCLQGCLTVDLRMVLYMLGVALGCCIVDRFLLSPTPLKLFLRLTLVSRNHWQSLGYRLFHTKQAILFARYGQV